jgi:hypothetical protein
MELQPTSSFLLRMIMKEYERPGCFARSPLGLEETQLFCPDGELLVSQDTAKIRRIDLRRIGGKSSARWCKNYF